jgi:putative solute:sodium symporter small subunit
MDEDRNVSAAGEAWSRLLRRTVLLLAIWFLVGPVFGILLVEPLNEISLGGIPLGFWISQQGSIYVFIVLIFAYAWMGDRLDRDSRGHAAGGAPAGGFTGREG